MEPRRPRESQNNLNPVLSYEIKEDKNDALILNYGTTHIWINKDCNEKTPLGKSYEQRRYGWNIIYGYDKIEEGNKIIYRFKVYERCLDINKNERGDILSIGLKPTEYIYLPVECLINQNYFGVYGVLIGVEFIVTNNGNTFELINRIIKLKPERVREVVEKQLDIQRRRIRDRETFSYDIEVRFKPNDYEIVEVKGIPNNIVSCEYQGGISIRGKETLNSAIENANISIESIKRRNRMTLQEPSVQPIQPARPIQRNIVLNEGTGFNSMNTVLRGQTGTFTKVIGRNIQTIRKTINGIDYLIKEGKELIEEIQFVNGRQVGLPRRYVKSRILEQRPVQSTQYIPYGIQRMNPFQQPNQPRREPIMRNVPTNREVINVDEETEDNSVYSQPIGPERRPIAQIRPVTNIRINEDDTETIDAIPMEEEENQSITEEEPQIINQQNPRAMSDSETESDSETVEVKWN